MIRKFGSGTDAPSPVFSVEDYRHSAAIEPQFFFRIVG
jgi:hypothetical protein